MSFLTAPSRGKLLRDLAAYIRTDNTLLDRRFKKNFTSRTEIDFENIRYLHSRTRQDTDTLRYLRRNRLCAGVIKAKEEFPEANIVHKHSEALLINLRLVRNIGYSEPWRINIDEDEEVVKCYCEDVQFHTVFNDFPMGVVWTRFIPGKANRMLMKVMPDDWKQSEASFRGGRLTIENDSVFCNVYTEKHPRVLKANVQDCKPGGVYTLADLVRDLPDGIELSPEYKTPKTPIFSFEKSIKSKIYFEHLRGRFDYTRTVDIAQVLLNLEPDESKKVAEPAMKFSSTSFLSEEEEGRIRKLASHLGKDFEELKQEIIEARLKLQEEGKGKGKKK
jgi:hypothetical protein